MSTLDAFPITRKWPAQHPDRLQLYSLPTPNGVKVSIMLEETGLPYEAHRVNFETHDQTSPECLSLNPNNKIPAILDPNGKPLALLRGGRAGGDGRFPACHARAGGFCRAACGDKRVGNTETRLMAASGHSRPR